MTICNSNTKTITFQGKEYNVPLWAKYVDMDSRGVYVFEIEPCFKNGFCQWNNGKIARIGDATITPICVEL